MHLFRLKFAPEGDTNMLRQVGRSTPACLQIGRIGARTVHIEGDWHFNVAEKIDGIIEVLHWANAGKKHDPQWIALPATRRIALFRRRRAGKI